MNALSQKDQMKFNLQGNIFYQLDRQNRGEWKKIVMSIMKTMEELNVDIAHITTAVVYARENGNFVKQNDKFMVELCYKEAVKKQLWRSG